MHIRLVYAHRVINECRPLYGTQSFMQQSCFRQTNPFLPLHFLFFGYLRNHGEPPHISCVNPPFTKPLVPVLAQVRLGPGLQQSFFLHFFELFVLADALHWMLKTLSKVPDLTVQNRPFFPFTFPTQNSSFK